MREKSMVYNEETNIKEDKTMTFITTMITIAMDMIQALINGILMNRVGWMLGIGYLIVDGAIIMLVWLILRVRQFMKEEEES